MSASRTTRFRCDGGYVWYEVTAVSAARDRELSEVRDKVVAAYKKAQVDKQLTKMADEIRDRLANGDAIDAIATEAGSRCKTADRGETIDRRRRTLTAAAIQAAFDGPKGYAAVAAGPGPAEDRPRRDGCDRAALFLRRAGHERRRRSGCPPRSPTTSSRPICRPAAAAPWRHGQPGGAAAGDRRDRSGRLITGGMDTDAGRTRRSGFRARSTTPARRRSAGRGWSPTSRRRFRRCSSCRRAGPTAFCWNRSKAARFAAAIRSSASSPT